MPTQRIKGITVEIGGNTTGLSKSLQDVNKTIYKTRDELKDVERLLKLDPTNTELLRQKQRLLAQEIEGTEQKLNALKEAEKQVQEQFERGDISQSQYEALKREIIETERQLQRAQQEAENTERTLRDIDAGTLQDVAEAADDAEHQLREAGEEVSHFGDYLKAEAIVEGAKGIVSSLKNVAEESKEYMKIMGSLEVSSAQAGYSAEETAETYKMLYGVLADEQSAATTTANLQAIGMSQKDLNRLTNIAIGTWATYGDSIPIDGLAEAINETSKTGTVTGVLADALNWAGVSEDEFNEKLAKMNDESERANAIMEQLASQGLEETGEAWRENNAALIEYNEANAEFKEQMAELGETVMPLFTELTEIVAGLLEQFNALDPSTQLIILSVVALAAALGPVLTVAGGISKGITGLISIFSTVSTKVLPALQNAFSSVFGFIASNPVVLLIGAIVGLVALIAGKGDEIQGVLQNVDNFLQNVFATDWTKIFGPVLGEALNSFFADLKNIWDSVKTLFNGIIDFVRGVFTGDWQRAWNGVKEIFSGIFGGLTSIAKSPLNGVIGLLNMAINAVNSMINGFNGIGFDMPDWLGGGSWHPSIPTIPNIAYLAEGGILSSGTAVVGEAGPEILTVSGGRAVVQPLSGSATAGKGLGDIVSILNAYLPYLAESGNIVLDTGELVGAMAPKMNDEFGRIAVREKCR